MRRKNAIEIEVVSPTKGLWTRMPSDQPEKSTGRAMTVALNVRFEDGVVAAAPGMELIKVCPAGALDGLGEINFLQQSNITSGVADIQKDSPIVGFSNRMYRLDRRFGSECLQSDNEGGGDGGGGGSPIWTIDTTELADVDDLVGFEVHAYTGGDPVMGAETTLVASYTVEDDFQVGDMITITSLIEDPSLGLVDDVYRFYVLLRVLVGIAGASGNGLVPHTASWSVNTALTTVTRGDKWKPIGHFITNESTLIGSYRLYFRTVQAIAGTPDFIIAGSYLDVAVTLDGITGEKVCTPATFEGTPTQTYYPGLTVGAGDNGRVIRVEFYGVDTFYGFREFSAGVETTYGTPIINDTFIHDVPVDVIDYNVVVDGSGEVWNRDTVTSVATAGFSGSSGQGVMLDGTYQQDKLGGYTEFDNKDTGFTISVSDGGV